MFLATLIILTPLAVCLALLSFCAVKRVQCRRLTARLKGIGGYSLLFAAVYTPVVLYFLSSASDYQ